MSLQDKTSLSSSDAVVNTALTLVETVDTQEEVSVPEVMLLVAAVVDSSVCSLLNHLQEDKSFSVLVLEEAVVIVSEEPVVANKAEKVTETAVLVLLKIKVAKELLVTTVHNSVVETVTPVDIKPIDLMTDPAVELDTSAVKVDVMMPEAVAVVLVSVTLR